MELNSALSLLQRLPAPRGVEIPPELRAEPIDNRRAARLDGFDDGRRTPSSEAVSRADHRAKFVDRLESMTRMLDQVKAAAVESETATTLVVEREGAETRSLAYSIFQGDSGAPVEQFVFTVSFKSQDGLTKTAPTPPAQLLASLNQGAEDGNGTDDGAPSAVTTPSTPDAAPAPVQQPATPVVSAAPVNAEPVDAEPVDAETAPVAPAEGNSARTATNDAPPPADESLSFDERVRQLIEYYRTDKPQGETAQSPTSTSAGTPETTSVESNAATNDALEEFIAIASERVRNIALGSDNDELFIDATLANRILSGRGDDVLDITAQEATRIDAAKGDDVIYIDAERAARIRAGSGDDIVTVIADIATRIKGARGDDNIFVEADRATRIRGDEGDDVININARFAQRIAGAADDDTITIAADKADRIYGGLGDDTIEIEANTISRVGGGSGDDTITLRADTIDEVNADEGDDTIILEAKDAAVRFSAGGGQDVIDIESVGSLAIDIDKDLATDVDEISVDNAGGQITLGFASGEQLTINNTQNADYIALRVGGETVELQLSEPPETLDVVV